MKNYLGAGEAPSDIKVVYTELKNEDDKAKGAFIKLEITTPYRGSFFLKIRASKTEAEGFDGIFLSKASMYEEVGYNHEKKEIEYRIMKDKEFNEDIREKLIGELHVSVVKDKDLYALAKSAAEVYEPKRLERRNNFQQQRELRRTSAINGMKKDIVPTNEMADAVV